MNALVISLLLLLTNLFRLGCLMALVYVTYLGIQTLRVKWFHRTHILMYDPLKKELEYVRYRSR